MAAIAILPLVAGAAAAGHVAAFVAIRAQCACSAVLNSRLWKAAERGDAPAVAKLLKTRVWVDRKTTKVSSSGAYALAARATSGAPNLPPQRRYTALHFAAANGHAAVVRLLLERADALCRDAVRARPRAAPTARHNSS
jgi:ankyrin repeat protein